MHSNVAYLWERDSHVIDDVHKDKLGEKDAGVKIETGCGDVDCFYSVIPKLRRFVE